LFFSAPREKSGRPNNKNKKGHFFPPFFLFFLNIRPLSFSFFPFSCPFFYFLALRQKKKKKEKKKKEEKGCKKVVGNEKRRGKKKKQLMEIKKR
jgi:hypothetical protein